MPQVLGRKTLVSTGARTGPGPRWGLFRSAVWSGGLFLVACQARAGVFGLPTQIGTDGRVCTGNNAPAGIACTAAALDPPGYLILHGVDDVDAAGDTVHQMRLFIEVTGTTLDVRVFDPGRSGLRDNPQTGTTTFTYTLLTPAGATLKTITLGADTATTENRVARMSSAAADTAFVALNAGTAFTVTPGRHELRVTASNAAADDDRNGFGLDVRDGTGANAAHYNVYTYGLDDDAGAGTSPPAADTSLIIGTLSAGTNAATITQAMIGYTYVTRGCDLGTNNYDMDQATASASLTSVLGVNSALTLSGNANQATTTVAIHPAAGLLTDSYNYGLWPLQNNTGTQFNVIDWRFADFRGWQDNPAALPRDTVDALRSVLPNGYVGGVPPLSNATAPVEPVLTATYAYVSGTNPPAAGQPTRFIVQVQLYNPGPAPIALNAANDQIVSGLPTGATNLGSIFCVRNQWGAPVGTPVNGGTFARCDFSGANLTLAVGDVVLLSYQFDFTPAAAGTFAITNPPAAPAAGLYNAGALAPNSTTWAQYSRFPGGTTLAETLGPICNLRAQTGTLVTRATLRGLRVDARGAVDFATGSQRGTLGFNVYAARTPDLAGRLVRLNDAPLEARLRDTLDTQLYHLDTAPAADAPYLVLEELESGGRRRLLGPFPASDRRLRRGFERAHSEVQAAWQAGRARRRAAPLEFAPRPAEASVSGAALDAAQVRGLVIELAGAGQARLPIADLQAAGLPWPVPDGLRLTRLGAPVAFEVSGRAGAEELRFASPGLNTAFTRFDTFVLQWDAARTPTVRVPLTYDEPEVESGLTRVTRRALFAPGAPLGASPWLWDYLAAGVPWPPADDPEAGSFDLPRLAPQARGSVALRLRLNGVSPGLHHVSARLNGVAVGSVGFAGRGPATLVGALDAALLRPIGNELQLDYESEPAAQGLVYLSHLDLALPLAGPLPSAPLARLRAFAPELPRLSGADYLIVSPRAFLPAAEQLAAFQARQGHTPVVATLERVYDAYAAGVVDASALRALIADARRAGTRFVLLLGDDTHDPAGHASQPPPDFVPSLSAWDDEFGRVPSENLYADVDGDGAPDVAIGRLPARDADEALALVAKVARQGASSQARQVLAADNQAPGEPSFEGFAQAAAQLLPAGTPANLVRLSEGVEPARAALFASFEAGVSVAHFFGHGSFDRWADEALLQVDDMGALAGASEPVVFTWACEAQWYTSPFGPSLGEALVLLPHGGATASFGPAGITAAELQWPLYRELYPLFFDKRLPLGEAIREAKTEALRADPGRLRGVVEGFNLLGDPALVLRP